MGNSHLHRLAVKNSPRVEHFDGGDKSEFSYFQRVLDDYEQLLNRNQKNSHQNPLISYQGFRHLKGNGNITHI